MSTSSERGVSSRESLASGISAIPITNLYSTPSVLCMTVTQLLSQDKYILLPLALHVDEDENGQETGGLVELAAYSWMETIKASGLWAKGKVAIVVHQADEDKVGNCEGHQQHQNDSSPCTSLACWVIHSVIWHCMEYCCILCTTSIYLVNTSHLPSNYPSWIINSNYTNAQKKIVKTMLTCLADDNSGVYANYDLRVALCSKMHKFTLDLILEDHLYYIKSNFFLLLDSSSMPACSDKMGP